MKKQIEDFVDISDEYIQKLNPRNNQNMNFLFLRYQQELNNCFQRLNLSNKKLLNTFDYYKKFVNTFALKLEEFQGNDIDLGNFVDRKKYNNDYRYLKLCTIYKIWIGRKLN